MKNKIKTFYRDHKDPIDHFAVALVSHSVLAALVIRITRSNMEPVYVNVYDDNKAKPGDSLVVTVKNGKTFPFVYDKSTKRQ